LTTTADAIVTATTRTQNPVQRASQ
jgi:hypothetical protein